MNIYIRERFRPFSHLPGTKVIVPGSDWILEVFPTLLKVQGKEFSLCKEGPVKDFTVQSDLERECVWIWGEAPDGYFRLQIFANEEGLFMKQKKGEVLLLAQGGNLLSNKLPERLFLGCHKAQDWDLARRRLNPSELAPALFVLGQKVPGSPAHFTFDARNFKQNFLNFYLSKFCGLLSPNLEDSQYLGIEHPNLSGNFISGAYLAIRSFLIQGSRILPNLPSDWVSGRAIHLRSDYGLIDLEWSRGLIRRLWLHANSAQEFQFPKEIRSFRVQKIGEKILYDKFQK